jgi:hypothetical protein
MTLLASPTRRLTFALVLVVASLFTATFNEVASANAATIAQCTTHDHLSAKYLSPNGASGWFYFLIAFTNSGATSCTLSGVPHAQPVQGPGKTPVGPAAAYQPTDGVSPKTVVLHAHGGHAFVEYYVSNEGNFSKRRCEPRAANGVNLRPSGLGNFYIPISRRGATEVCTRLANTGVGALSSTSY